MKMHSAGLKVLAAVLAATPAPALAWGQTGHRVVAAIADDHLSGLSHAQIRQILGVESLDEAGTWPDEMRSEKTPFWQRTANPWHYVTIGGHRYDLAPPEGDAIVALAKFRAALLDPATSKEDQQVALRFIVHLVADLHQPLHVGKPGDRGGNNVKVTWFGKPTNLHAVWDSAIVDDQGLSFTELAERLDRHISPETEVDWWVKNPVVWTAEGAQLRDTLYPAATDLGYDYAHVFTPVVNKRLSMGGIRLAAYLNQLFEERVAPRDGRQAP